MSLTDGAELLGSSASALKIKGAGAHTVVVMKRAILDKLTASFEGDASEKSRHRIDLVLEDIQGGYDAAALSVYLNFPEWANPGDHSDLLAGSVGLYGLRRASLPHDAGGPTGLTFVLDATPIFLKLFAAHSLPADEIRVSVIPHRQLPEGVEIVVKRMALFWQRY